MSKKGYIQIYTGDGKGKTTAAMGLIVRAVGAGMRVLFAQFIKSQKCSEHHAFEKYLPMVEVRQYGKGFISKKRPPKCDIEQAQIGLSELTKDVSSGKYDLIVLDEVNVATHLGLIKVEDLINLIKNKHIKTEIVITGRYADEKILQIADLVTEMKEIKHYFSKGIKARKGIEK
ncbi:MAG: cob(I)yrinic acid a,c-diamide adenosyltransferase [Thermodesulfovibrionales bacterium]|nr:cob(I)yrinic acid a,c-diamide adenosyltransferase [Thermodesulfovibrionales bacterium]